MALKLNIRKDIEDEMDELLAQTSIRSKTEYINQAIKVYNREMKREFELARLRRYFKTYRSPGKDVLHDFAAIRAPLY